MRRPSLDAAELAGLAPDLVVEVLETVTSTNAVAADRARDGAPEGTVVVAEHQTSGRGRLDRSWEAPPRSSLVFSLVLRPTVPPASWPWLPLLTGYTLAKGLRGRGYAGVAVKWPNDVLVGERKVAGILVERVDTPSGPAAVVGVGLNVSQQQEEIPVPTGTSLTLETGEEPDRTALLKALLSDLREAYDAWQVGGSDGAARLRSSYTAACVTVGREVRVGLPSGETVQGRATGVDGEGRLVVVHAAGEIAVGAGDVVHVRPTPGADQ